MKALSIAMALCLLPLPSLAVTRLAVCDGKSYDVAITNGGQMRTAHITPTSGVIEEYGPTVTFRIKGQPPVTATGTYDEYCIWNGKIDIQTRDIGIEGHGGGG